MGSCLLLMQCLCPTGIGGLVSLNNTSSIARGGKRANSNVARRGSQGTTAAIGGSLSSTTTAVNQSQSSAAPRRSSPRVMGSQSSVAPRRSPRLVGSQSNHQSKVAHTKRDGSKEYAV